MFKSAVRRYSLKSLPYEAQPKNKYNAQRSAFNLKPKEKDYSLTPEVVGEILKLRRENPDEWTVPKLAKKFNVDKVKVNVISGISKERQEKVLQELEEVKSTWSAKRKLARQDREKRTQQWLRGEF
ncbi:hypothetical protein SBP28_000016 [Candidozyma auris]|nr:hypothetical protein CJJ09_000018 [[Candida] auris]